MEVTSKASENSDGHVLHYLCQQAVRQGQGGYAHVNEIISGLTRRGWHVQLFQPSYGERGQVPALALRLPAMVRAETSLIFARPRPDVVYIRSHTVSNLVARWCVRKSIPYVVEVNGSPTDAAKAHPVLQYMSGFRHYTSTWTWRHAAAIIVVTPELKEYVQNEAPRVPVAVVPTGANTDLFRTPVGQQAPIAVPYVIFFGSLAPWHDLETMLSAIELPSWPPEVSLVILGSGQRARLAEEAAGRNHRIIYKAAVPYAEVPMWVGHALAALSLLRTGNGLSASPVKLYESMACAVPVIVSEARGQANLIRETQSGIVIPEGDPAALAGAVAALWDNPDESARMGERGRHAVELSHSWDVRAEQTHRILLEALHSAGRQRK